jgi:hypothetical protein
MKGNQLVAELRRLAKDETRTISNLLQRAAKHRKMRNALIVTANRAEAGEVDLSKGLRHALRQNEKEMSAINRKRNDLRIQLQAVEIKRRDLEQKVASSSNSSLTANATENTGSAE